MIERVTFPSGSLTLEGALHLPERTPAPGVVMCHPHPQYGGDMSSGVVYEVCAALASAGIVALRFNFRGVGASEGSFDGGRGEQYDVKAAIAWLSGRSEVDDSRLGLAGYSFGALMALAAAPGVPSVRAMALVSPPAGAARFDGLPDGLPVLVVTGGNDTIAPPEGLRASCADRANARFEVVEGADHFWWSGMERLRELLTAFFSERLAGDSPGAE